jgi:transcriptional regulator with XRE-family HTH domain
MSDASTFHPFPEFHLGDRLRKAREATGLDMKTFAEQVGVSRDTLRHYETGATIPRRPVLLSIAMRTGFTVDQLTDWEHPDGPAGQQNPPTKWETHRHTAEVIELRTIRPTRQEVAAA